MSPSSLRGLDDRVLPVWAARIQHTAATVHASLLRLSAPGTLVGDATRSEPTLAGSVLAVFAASVLVAVLGIPGPGPADERPVALDTAAPVAPVVTSLGAQPGDSVADYLTRAAFDLRVFGERSKGRAGYALVSLRRYLTPAELAAAIPGIEVARAYVRAPLAKLPTQTHAVPLDGGLSGLPDGIRAGGELAAGMVRTYRALLAGLSPNNAQQKAFRGRYELQLRGAAAEAAALARPATCACVFAVIVRADYVHLAGLVRSVQVRAVDPAPAEAKLQTMTVLPIRPEFVTIVPNTGPLGG